jgi:RNA polymerase sigma-70 factor (ECF subfamily)
MDYASTDERKLVQACVQGNSDAWSELVRRFIRLVFHVVRETLLFRTGKARREDVDDLTEEVFTHLVDKHFRALARLQEPFHLKSWLAVVTKRKVLDACKKKEIHTVSLDQPLMKEGDTAPLEQFLGVESTSSLDAEEIRVVICKAPLNGKERLLITLTYFHEKSYREIAEMTRMPQNSIGPTLRRALDKLKKALAVREQAGQE